MCGIIGITSKEEIKKDLIQGLENLEYRGYDSVGIYLNELIKIKGRVHDLKKIIPFNLNSSIGLGHSRWATHGEVNETNAHPFISMNNTFVLVHNGIINNYMEIKKELELHNYSFKSETDSEVIVNLLDCYYEKYHDSFKALELTLKQIEGTYALGIINIKEKDKIYFAKKESPLMLGLNKNYNFIVSDINSSYFLSDNFINLNDDEYGYLSNSEIKIFKDSKEINKERIKIDITNKNISKENYEHFMLKEIHDEPKVLKRILNTYTKNNKITISPSLIKDLKESEEITILGCGTSYHAGLIGKEAFERLCKKKVNVYLASEFNNINLINPNATYLLLSQSGETIDLKLAYNQIENKNKVYTFTNVLTSSLSLLAKESFDLCADIEIAVASTKAYISEISLLLMLAYKLINQDEEFISNIYNSINSINETLNNQEKIIHLANKIKDTSSIFFLGRGIDHLINLESSLKLKEITYLHSEAMYGGELKHGSIALISDESQVIGLITNEKNKNSLLNNLKEVEARKANITLISSKNLTTGSYYELLIENELFAAINAAPFFQLLSYYTAKIKKRDIDKPRNLAKSCTVE